MFALVPRRCTLRVNVAATLLALASIACGGGESTAPTKEQDKPATVATLTVTPTQVSLVLGQPQALQATARDANGGTIASAVVTWTTASASVATVGTDGRVTGVGIGTTTVTAKSGNAEATVAVTVSEGAYVTTIGGSFSLLGGKVRMEVPINAVANPTVFTARVVGAPATHARILASTAVAIEPAATFSSAVRLRLAYSAPLAADVVEPQLRVAQFASNAWQESPVLIVDRTNKLAAGSITSTGTYAVFVPPPTLRSYAQVRGFDIGTAVDNPEMTDAALVRAIAAEFNVLTPGNAMKFGPIHPQPATYAFTNADTIVGLAVENGMKIHGHVLVWHSQQPAWLTAATQTRTTLLAALKGHIETVVGRYAGKIATWDVANEMVSDDGTGLRKSFWIDVVGPDVIDSAFTWARRVDPNAKLFLNDYAVEGINRKSDSLFALANRLKTKGIPIDGVGLQAHFMIGAPTQAQMSANIARFAAIGLDIRFTELDVRLPDGTDNLAAQGTIYGNTIKACLAAIRCRALTVWGLSDKHSWIPSFFPGFGRGLPFDENYVPKPAYNALRDALQQP